MIDYDYSSSEFETETDSETDDAVDHEPCKLQVCYFLLFCISNFVLYFYVFVFLLLLLFVSNIN